MALILISETTQMGDPSPKAGDYYSQAITYLQGSTTAKKIIHDLETCNRDIYLFIQENAFSMFAHHEMAKNHGFKGSVIVWAPKATITAHGKDAATMQSPAIGLLHEMGHGIQWVKNHGWFMAYVNNVLAGDAQKMGSLAYKSKMIIENDNISTHETPVAKELNEGTRANYTDAANFSEAKRNYKCPYPMLPLVD